MADTFGGDCEEAAYPIEWVAQSHHMAERNTAMEGPSETARDTGIAGYRRGGLVAAMEGQPKTTRDVRGA